MQFIIAEVYVPTLSKSFDFRLPSTGRIGDVVHEMVRILETTQQGLIFDEETPLLCDRNQERILKYTDTVAGSGLQDGVSLILV